MTSSLLIFLAAAGVIVLAGAALTQFADVIAHTTKLGGMFVGSIMPAGAASLPELATDISAVRIGEVNLAVGDLVGSCLFNLLILAVLDLTRYSHGRMLPEISAAHALSASMSIALTAIAAIFIFLGPRLETVAVAGIGPGSVLLVLAHVAGMRVLFMAQTVSSEKSKPRPAKVFFLPRSRRLTWKQAVIGYAACAGVILAAAPFLARAAAELAEQSGLGGTFFGTTFVALCTSLPEMVTTFTAVRMQAFDLAVGNIFGSNCFNLVVLAVLDAFDGGSLLATVSATHVLSALGVILVTSVLVIGQLHRIERKKAYLEPDAWLAIALVAGTVSGVYVLSD